MKNISNIANSIIAGRIQPQIKSSFRGSFTLLKRDFKDDSIFDYIATVLGLDSEFHKEIKKLDTGDEPVTELNDYDEIEIHVNNSIMR